MGYTALSSADVIAGKYVSEALMSNIKENFDYLYANIGGGGGGGGGGNLVTDGGFEIDADSDGLPDNWTISLYTGGGATLITTATSWVSPVCGAKSMCVIHPGGDGNGGAIVASDYFDVSPWDYQELIMIFYGSVTALNNTVGLQYFNASKVSVGYALPYASSAIGGGESTVVGRRINLLCKATSTAARYAKVEIKCCATSATVAGYVVIDDVSVNSVPRLKYNIRQQDVVVSTALFSSIATGSTGFRDVSSALALLPVLSNVQNTCKTTYKLTVTGDDSGVAAVRLRSGSQYSNTIAIYASNTVGLPTYDWCELITESSGAAHIYLQAVNLSSITGSFPEVTIDGQYVCDVVRLAT